LGNPIFCQLFQFLENAGIIDIQCATEDIRQIDPEYSALALVKNDIHCHVAVVAVCYDVTDTEYEHIGLSAIDFGVKELDTAEDFPRITFRRHPKGNICTSLARTKSQTAPP